MSWRRLASFLGGAIALAGVARAYAPITRDGAPYVFKWEQSPVLFQVKLPNVRNHIDGESQASSVVQAMAQWNAELGTVQLTSQIVAPGPVGFDNGVSEISVESTINGDAFPAGVLAVTLSQGGNAFEESDIIFNAARSWNSYRGGVRDVTMDMRRVAIHELGHALGLDHPDEKGQTVTAIMNSHVSSVDRLMSDDIAGGQFLYGAPGFTPVNDLFSNAAALVVTAGDAVNVNGSNIAAQSEPGEALHAGSTSGRSVWWKWTAPGHTTARLTTLGSNFDTVLAVYTGTAVGQLTPVMSNDDVSAGVIRTSEVSFEVVGGMTYYIAIDGWGDGDRSRFGYTGSITLNLSYGPLLTGPVFTHHPQSTSVDAGAQVVLTTASSANPSATFRWQWRRAGGEWADLAPNQSYYPSGVDSSSLVIATVFALNGNQYRMVATNSQGMAVSQPATIEVRPVPLPVITLQPRDSVVYGDTPVPLELAATGATWHQWYRDGMELPGQTWASYWATEAGTYHAAVTNPGGTVLSGLVKVIAKPKLGVTSVRAVNRRTQFMRADGSRWRMGLVFPHGLLIGAPEPFSNAAADAVATATAMGDSHELMVRPGGTLWISGNNSHGELGLGDTEGRYVPTWLTRDVVAVAAGAYSSYFIKSDGSLWGAGYNGQGNWAADQSSISTRRLRSRTRSWRCRRTTTTQCSSSPTVRSGAWAGIFHGRSATERLRIVTSRCGSQNTSPRWR